MSKLILIETSTSLCSAALAVDEKIVEYRESSVPKAHASLTAVFIKEMLDAQGLKVKDCDAVCISSGPGSYTGLRVGASTAKGLCFASSLPLVAVDTLELLAYQAIEEGLLPQGCTKIIPMIDARRMEVYTASFSPDAARLSQTRAEVMTSSSLDEELKSGPCLLLGDGAAKCKEIIDSPNMFIAACNPKASALLTPALRKFRSGEFEDIAYFEPFYLKQYIATVSNKKLF